MRPGLRLNGALLAKCARVVSGHQTSEAMSRPSVLHLIALLFLNTSLASCQKEDDSAPATDLTLRQELTFTIPPGQQGTVDLTVAFDARDAVNGLLAQHGFSPEQLRDVRIADARAVMIEPLDSRFTNVASVHLGYRTPDGQLAAFAHIAPVPADQGILELGVDHTDLTADFAGAPQDVHAVLAMSGRTGDQVMRVRFALEFRVKASE